MCSFLCGCCKKKKNIKEEESLHESQLKIASSNLNCKQRSSIPSIFSNNQALLHTFTNINNINSTKNIQTLSILSGNPLLNFNPNAGFASDLARKNHSGTKLRYNARSCSYLKEIHQTNFEKEQEKYFVSDLKDKVRCFFCGGQKCKYENYLENENFPNAIKGLNSNYITDDIIASQRPSDFLIRKYDLLNVFKEKKIGLVVNLQREGEHPYCGPSSHHIPPSGFSYNPTVFSGDDIKCKLSGWVEMSVPSSMNFVLEIVKEMTVAIKEKGQKVLVHCHAGFGRTGIVIACYLLYNTEDSVDDVISYIRNKRKKCVETSEQRKYCETFAKFITDCKVLFSKERLSIDVYLKRQEDLLYGAEKKKYGFVPRLITKCFEKIMTIKKKYNLSNSDIYTVIINSNFKWDNEYESILISLKRSLNKNVWNLFDEIENLIFIKVLLFDWFEDCVIFAISPTRVEHIITSSTYKACLVDNGIIDSQKINELFNIIKSELNIYEYEIIFQVAAFAALIPVENGNDNKDLFIDMLDRISFGLMGFVFGKKEVVEDKHVQELVTGLTSIINLIYESLIISLSPIKNISKLELRNYDGKRISSIGTIKMISPSRNRSSIFYSQIPTAKVNGIIKDDQVKEEAESPQEEQPNFIRKIRRSIYMHMNNTIKEKESEVGSNSLRSDKNETLNRKSVLEEIYKDELDKNIKISSGESWNSEGQSNSGAMDIGHSKASEKPQIKSSTILGNLPDIYSSNVVKNDNSKTICIDNSDKKNKSGFIKKVRPILKQLMEKNERRKTQC